MARKCQSKNPSTCNIHGVGGKKEQLAIAYNKALKDGDYKKAFKIREESESLSDVVDAKEKEKLSFFGRIASRFHTLEDQPAETEQPTAEPVEEVKPYTGLTMDCGTCSSCDPAPSDLTHFRRWSGIRSCERPIPMPAQEVVSKTLAKNFEFLRGRTKEQNAEFQAKVASILDDPSKTSSDGSSASKAAEEVRGLLWDDYSERNGNKDTLKGGGASAYATVEIFHSLGRQEEVGWILEDTPHYEAKHPLKHPFQEYGGVSFGEVHNKNRY